MFDRTKYGPWALILGASEGVGVAFARQLGDAGLNLILVARQAALLHDVATRVHAETGVEVRTLALDLTRADMLDRLRGVTDDVEVGLIVYNAGAIHGDGGPFLDVPLESALKVVQLNPVGQTTVAHHFGQRMAARGRGGIILMGSLAGNAGGMYVVGYSASKAFTQVLAEGLWIELKPQGVDVLCHVIGATDTPSRLRLDTVDKPGEIISAPEDIVRQALDNIANGPVITPPHMEEVFRRISSLARRQAAEAMRDILLGVTVVGAGGALRSQAVAERHDEIFGHPPRIPPLDRESAPLEVRAATDRLRKGVVGGDAPMPIDAIPEIMFTMQRYPGLWNRIMDLSIQIQGPESVLPVRDRKLAILRSGWLCRAPYEFGEHVNQSRRVGLTTQEIDRVKAGSEAAGWTDHERAILRAAEECIASAMVSDATWATLSRSLDDHQLVELLVVIGQFVATAYFQNSLRLRLEADNLGLAAG
jgi:short-subunit dehydrogenase/alkylhydroperoxidase family enzyme